MPSRNEPVLGLYLAIPVAIIFAVLQSSLAPQMQILKTTPHLPLLVMVAWITLVGRREGLLLALVAGIVLDTLSAAPFGTSILAMGIAGAVVALGERNIPREAWYLPYLAIAVASLLVNLVLLALLSVMGQPIPFLKAVWAISLPQVAINLVLMPLYYGMGLLVRRVVRPRFGGVSEI